MSKNPKIPIELTPTDKAVELIGWLSVLGVWALTFLSYNNLPETIPVHFNITGEADKFESKHFIFILPLISTVLFIGLTILNKLPHIFNYPTSITKESAYQQYTYATQMIRYVKLVLVLIFGFIILKINNSSQEEPVNLSDWFLPVIVLLLFVPIIGFLIKSVRSN